jgi:7,8-dihydroneopterin aldolase/epimerase/oxygenase
VTWERDPGVPDDPDDPDDRDEFAEDDALDRDHDYTPTVTIEISGLSLYTRHGVSEAERELGQRLVFDVSFELDECDATVTDRVEDTVDYADVCEQVALSAQERSYRTLERLCAAVADRLFERYGAESVRVKATKPEPPIPLPVDEVSVEVWREAG